jgi:hypothetical protein
VCLKRLEAGYSFGVQSKRGSWRRSRQNMWSQEMEYLVILILVRPCLQYFIQLRISVDHLVKLAYLQLVHPSIQVLIVGEPCTNT